MNSKWLIFHVFVVLLVLRSYRFSSSKIFMISFYIGLMIYFIDFFVSRLCVYICLWQLDIQSLQLHFLKHLSIELSWYSKEKLIVCMHMDLVMGSIMFHKSIDVCVHFVNAVLSWLVTSMVSFEINGNYLYYSYHIC